MIRTSPKKALATELMDLWDAGSSRVGVEERLQPANRADAYFIQSLFETRYENMIGWKLAATSKKGQEHINVDGPMAGRLFSARQLTSGSSVSLQGNIMRVAEFEFAVQMGKTLAPREIAYTPTDLADAVASIHPSIELPNTRISNFTEAGERVLIADNACTGDFVIGPAFQKLCEFDPRHQIVSGGTATIQRNGKAENALGSSFVALAWLANELSLLGLSLDEGAFVMTGTCVDPIPVVPGDQLNADFGELGTLGLSFTE